MAVPATPDSVLDRIRSDVRAGTADFDSTISLLSQGARYGGTSTTVVAPVRSWAEDAGKVSPGSSVVNASGLLAEFSRYVAERDAVTRDALRYFAPRERKRVIRLVAGTFPDDIKLAAIRALSELELTEDELFALARAGYSQRIGVVQAVADLLALSASAFSLVALELVGSQSEGTRAALSAVARRAAANSAPRQALVSFMTEPDTSAASLAQQPLITLLTLPLLERANAAQSIAAHPELRKSMAKVLVTLDRWVQEEIRKTSAKTGDFTTAFRDQIYEAVFVGDFDLPTGPQSLEERAFRQLQSRGDEASVSLRSLLDVCPEQRLLWTVGYFLDPAREDKVEQIVACLVCLGRRLPAEAQQFRERLLYLVGQSPDVLAGAALAALLLCARADGQVIELAVDRLKSGDPEGTPCLTRSAALAAPSALGTRAVGLSDRWLATLAGEIARVQDGFAAAELVLAFLGSLSNPVVYRSRVESALRLLDDVFDALSIDDERRDRVGEAIWQFAKRALGSASSYGRSARAESTVDSVDIDSRVEPLVSSCLASPVIRQTALRTYPEILESLSDAVAITAIRHLLFGEPIRSAAVLASVFQVTAVDAPRLILGPMTEVAAADPSAFKSAFLSSLVGAQRNDLIAEALEAVAAALGKAEQESAWLSAEKERGTGSFAAQVGMTVQPLLDRALEAARGNESLEAQYRLISFRLQEEGLLSGEERPTMPATLVRFVEEKAHLEARNLQVTSVFPPRLELPEGRFPGALFLELFPQVRKYAFTPGVVPAGDKSWFVALMAAVAERTAVEDLIATVLSEVGSGRISSVSDPAARLLWGSIIRQMDADDAFDWLDERLADQAAEARDDARSLLLWALEERSELVSCWPALPGGCLAQDMAAWAAERLASVSADVRTKREQLQRLHDDLWSRVARELGPVFTSIENVLYGYHVLRVGLAAEGWDTVERQLAKELKESEIRPEVHQVIGLSPRGRYRVRSSGLTLKGQTIPVEKAIVEGVD